MSALHYFLSDLRGRGVLLSHEGDRLICNAPKGVLTPELRAELARRKAEVLTFLQAGEATEAASPGRDERKELTLSRSQERLWIFVQNDPENPVYHVVTGLRLRGGLDQSALRRSLQELVERHESLRTEFYEEQGVPFARVLENAELPFGVEDLSPTPERDREARLQSLAFAEARRPFLLEQAPLMRAKLYQLTGEDAFLLLVIHHIVADGWSLGILAKELGALYGAYSSGTELRLPELRFGYRDYVQWELGPGKGLADEQLPFWLDRLHGPLPVLELPTDRRRPSVQTFQGRRLAVHLGQEIAGRIREVCQDTATTPFVLLLAAFKALLQRYTGVEDVLVGSGTSNRNRQEFTPLVGFFVNTLVLRTDLSGEPSFLELLRRVKETAFSAYAHQDVSFNLLLERMQPVRALNQSPLVQVFFTFQNVPLEGISLPGMEAQPEFVDPGIARADLSVEVWPEEQGFRCDFEYNSDLFEEATIRAMQGHFCTLLAAALADPRRPVGELPMLSAEERQTMLVGGNETATAYPEVSIPALFESYASSTPEALAVRSDAAGFSYGTLNEIANGIAHFLHALEISRPSFVGVCAEGSPFAIAGLLGILKAGHAYLPLDPTQPPERLQSAMQRAGTQVLLYSHAYAAHRVVESADGLYQVRELEGFSFEAVPHAPGVHVDPDNPAYLMFTSGTTGEPKGVVVPHRGVVRLVKGTGYLDFAPDQTFSQIAPLSFDGSTLEVWGALLNGGTLAVLSAEQRDATEIGAGIQRLGVTTTILTAALFHHMVETNLEGLLPLQQLLIGGDVLSPSHLRRLLTKAPQLHLVNAYGPTENTTITTCQTVTPATLERGFVPIGRPISNTRVYVLDDKLQPVPRGVGGQLFAAGDGLATGYLNSPEETAERFRTVAFAETGEQRVYATGDIVRFDAEGDLQFLGRRDSQIKLRGYRVELGEVQQALLAIPDVRAAVVMLRDEPGREQRLGAYIVPQSGVELESHALRLALRKILPEYEVPSFFQFLEEIPRTQNGKVDYAAMAALPPPAESRHGVFRAPITEEEQIVAGLFSGVLGVAAVSVEDDFFALGGHSLLVKQLLARIKQETGVVLPVMTLFQSPTVRDCARELASARRSVNREALPSPRRGPIEHELSRSQKRLWFLDRLQPGNPAYNLAIALRIRGPLNRDALAEAMNRIVERHEGLRTHFVEQDGQPFAEINDAQGWAMQFEEREDHPEDDGEELQKILQEQANFPFVLREGPLFRVLLVRQRAEEHIALFTMHHIISDAWSMGLLAKELGAFYKAAVLGSPSPLPRLPRQFRDFVGWEKKDAAAEAEVDLAYWKQRLSGELPTLDLPTDYPRPVVQTFQGRRSVAYLPADLVTELERLAREQNATLFMVMLAVFNVLLHQYTGQDEILVGTVTAGRREMGFEDTFGFFANTLVLRTDLQGNPSLTGLIRQVRETTVDAFEHQSVPFDLLVEVLQPERRLDRSAIFQALFTVLNAPLEPLRLGSLEVAPVPLESDRARYEIGVEFLKFEDRYRLDFEYNTDLFSAETIRQMQQQYIHLLEAAVKVPEVCIEDLSGLSAAGRHLLLETWNDTGDHRAPYETVPEWFRAQAGRTPDAVALVMGERSLTYVELQFQADLIAKALLAEGVTRNSVVGLYCRRGPALVIGLLGILNAGAAYLPLDIHLPRQRLEYLVADAQLELVLTDEDLLDDLSIADLRALVVGSQNSLERTRDLVPAPDPQPDAEDLAYLIYTSGSTGKPKGTRIRHRSLVNVLAAILREPGLASDDVLVALTTISFDIAALEILGPLVCGATLVLAATEVIFDPEALGALFDRSGATVVQGTPSTWRMLVEAGWMGQPGLRMWCGGEALSPALAESLLLRGRELWNLYGPTETTIWSARHKVSFGESPILVGRPIENTRFYILNPHGQPVAVGVPGELYIAGAGVAGGYWKREALTEERFLPDPFDTEAEGLMYRTGDRARYRRDGQVQLLGRMDHQIKLRGHRIELGEVEGALSEHRDVLEAVVAPSGEGADQKLVAYVRLAEGEAEAEELRSWLQVRLPEYMVPTHVIALQEIPRTFNGKVDRTRLPQPQPLRSNSQQDRNQPRNELEQQIAAIWSEVLGRHHVGMRDNFFDLGGHSLLLVRVHARLRQELDTRIGVIDLFRYPTVETIAAHLARNQKQALVAGASA